MKNIEEDKGHNEQKEDDPPLYSAHSANETLMKSYHSESSPSQYAKEQLHHQLVIENVSVVVNNRQRRVPNGLVNTNFKN